MSFWLKRSLAVGVVALVCCALLQLKSRRGDAGAVPVSDALEGLSTLSRAELREPTESEFRAPLGTSGRSPVERTTGAPDNVATTWRISGVVVNERNEPVAAAEILSGDNTVLGRSGEDGRFVLEGGAFPFVSDEDPVLTARTGEHSGSFVTDVSLEPGETIDGLVLVVVATRDVSVRFVDAVGRPVAGVECAANIADFEGRRQGLTKAAFEERELRSDEHGRATLEHWPRWASSLSAWCEDYESVDVELDVSANEVEIVLGWQFVPFELAGVVRDERGRPISGAALNCNFGPRARSAKTDADGRFALQLYRLGDPGRAEEGEAWLVVTAVDHEPEAVDLGSRASSPPVPLNITLKPELVISGTVFGPDGAPVWGALVNLRRDVSGRALREFHRLARRTYDRTDESGRFEIGSLWPGDFRMSVSGDKGMWPTSLDVPAGTRDIVVRLSDDRDGYAWVKVRALSLESGERFENFTVRIRDGGATYQHLMEASRAAVDGWVEMFPRQPGSFDVTVEVLGCMPCRMSARAYEAGEHELVFHVERSGFLALRIVDEHGLPLRGVQVAINGKGRTEGAHGFSLIKRDSFSTGYDGRCFVKHVPLGRVDLRLLNPAEGTRRSATLVADEEGIVEHVIRW